MELPPEGRRCPKLLDLGIAYDGQRLQIAADAAALSVDLADRPTSLERRANLERTLDVPDGWPLLYRAQLVRLERMAVRAGDRDAEASLARGRRMIGDLATQVERWWDAHEEQIGVLGAIEAALFEQRSVSDVDDRAT